MKKLLLILLCVPLMFSCEFFLSTSDKTTSVAYTSPVNQFINADKESYNRLIEITGSMISSRKIIEKAFYSDKDLTSKERSNFFEAYASPEQLREIFEGSIVKQG